MLIKSLKTSLIFALKLSLYIWGAKYISGVHSIHGSATYGFPSESISAISVMPSHSYAFSPKRSSFYGGFTTKNGSPSTLVAIPLYIKSSKQSKPPILFDILSSSLTENSPKNRKLADTKQKSNSSSYEPQQKYGIKQEQYQTEPKKMDEYANYASAGYASDEKQAAGVASQYYNNLQQNLKPQSNNKHSMSQKSQIDNSQRTDYSDISPAFDRFGLNKQTDALTIYDSSGSFAQFSDGELNEEKILHKKRENISYIGSNPNIGSYSNIAHDSGSNRPSNTVLQYSPSQSHSEVSSYSPFLRNSGYGNSGHATNEQINSQNKGHNNAMSANSADTIYTSASSYYNPTSNSAKNSYNSPYVTVKPFSPPNMQENYNLPSNFNEYNSETNNGEIKDNDDSYDYHSSNPHNSKKSNGYVIPSSNSANLDWYGKHTSSTGYMAKSNDGECYDSKAIHDSEYSFSPVDDQKPIAMKSLHAQLPTQTSSLTSYEADHIDPSKLDLKIVHLPISVLKRLVASGELGLPSFQ